MNVSIDTNCHSHDLYGGRNRLEVVLLHESPPCIIHGSRTAGRRHDLVIWVGLPSKFALVLAEILVLDGLPGWKVYLD